MNWMLKQIKDRLYWFLAEKNENIRREYSAFIAAHEDEYFETRYERRKLLIRLNFHYRIFRNKNRLMAENEIDVSDTNYYKHGAPTETADEVFEKLSRYDVVSFDIFDTALYRKVEKPTDVFALLAFEIGYEDFEGIRIQAERRARQENEWRGLTREVSLKDIYTVLNRVYGIPLEWMAREIELEIELSQANPFMLEIYHRLREINKPIIFISDMYLDGHTLGTMLRKNGYDEWDRLYVSCEYGKSKLDGALQKTAMSDFPGKKLIHVGDHKSRDIEGSEKAGMAALYRPSAAPKYREAGMDNLLGSFYRATINNHMYNGLWDRSLHYSHGYRVGGILTALFCGWLNHIAKQKGIDKILFCARDCEFIHKAYNEYYRDCDNAYLQISRYAIMSVTAERYLHHLIDCTIMRGCREHRYTKTIYEIFHESGFGYLVQLMPEAEIDPYAIPAQIDTRKLENFIYNRKGIILEHNSGTKEAAAVYFKSLIGNAKNILIVDVAWSGTCLSASKYFIENNIGSEINIHGALMFASEAKSLKAAMETGFIDAFVCSPFENDDIHSSMFPKGEEHLPNEATDRLRLPLEYLFTSCEASLTGYALDSDGHIAFERNSHTPENMAEIRDMQAGMIDFIETFEAAIRPYHRLSELDLWHRAAFIPLLDAIRHTAYCYQVYKNFAYDARPTVERESGSIQKFGVLFQDEPWQKDLASQVVSSDGKKRILFFTPELTYTGTPRSLLRMCKVAIALGYYVEVWSALPGPFADEYRRFGIDVQIVPVHKATDKNIARRIRTFDLAICNTIVTDQFARICCRYVPTVWYIREATNITNFTRGNPQMQYLLRHFKGLYCVSEYAAEALKPYTNHPIKVVRNCVEDEADIATPYSVGTSDKIRFVQMGTIEYRKGYDVLISAYRMMPVEYQQRAEIYIAGRGIKSSRSYCAQLFEKVNAMPNVHYLGVLTGDDKTKRLSEMDVVVVASRDESCSLVALEGAMLSKPLIVTENVGAKYMVKDDNGFIVKTGDARSLSEAMMRMIDKRERLMDMGMRSRAYYEELASMNIYTREMEEMFRLSDRKHTLWFRLRAMRSLILTSEKIRMIVYRCGQICLRHREDRVIVSLTSHPGRISTVHQCIASLVRQSVRPEKVLLWLSKRQFPNGEAALPEQLISLKKNPRFEIRWTEDDLAPHKKYYYAMGEYPDYPLITVDDDAIYDSNLVERLMDSYRRFPKCISAMRVNMFSFTEDGRLDTYNSWVMDYQAMTDTPSRQLMPTGVGGVLYPPHALPKEAFDKNAIMETCLYCDDLWLKVWSLHNGYETVVPEKISCHTIIEGSQNVALWHTNVNYGNNDESMARILRHYQALYPDRDWVRYAKNDNIWQ